MIQEHTENREDAYTEGFEVMADGLTVMIKEGQLNFISDVTVHKPIYSLEGETSGYEEKSERLVQTFAYPEFSFSINPHEMVPVQYDVYLVQIDARPVYQLDRTLLDGLAEPEYEGKGELLHSLLRLVVPPFAETLDEVIVHVNLLDLENVNSVMD